MSESLTPSALMYIMLRATVAGMAVVRQGQRGDVGHVETKQGDGHNTVVTRWDKDSEVQMLSVLAETGLNVHSEEIGFVRNAKGRQALVLLVDPLDGSKPFAIGAPTSTVSVGLYDIDRRTMVAVTVGEPATGRIWFAEEGKGAWSFYSEEDLNESAKRPLRMKVWPGQFDSGSVVLLDCYHGFKLAQHPATPNATWGRLWSALNELGIVYGFGTNCGHYAYTAFGRNSVVGTITTCRGGPHDIAAGLLIVEAGGVVRSFTNSTGILIEVGPLDVLHANFMIAANSVETMDVLVSHFRQCLERS